jgi:hypothetical protein
MRDWRRDARARERALGRDFVYALLAAETHPCARRRYVTYSIGSSRPDCCTGTAIEMDGGLVQFPL